MHIKEVKTKEHLLLVLYHINDFCDPIRLVGKTPVVKEMRKWIKEMSDDCWVEIGREEAFRYSLSLLPDMEDVDFVDLIITLCTTRPLGVQRAIANRLNMRLEEF
jgi:hypothetical protein